MVPRPPKAARCTGVRASIEVVTSFNRSDCYRLGIWGGKPYQPRSPEGVGTLATVFDVNVEDPVEPLNPALGGGTRRTALAGGLMDRDGDDTVAVLDFRGKHAVVSGEMGAGAWDEGGEAGDEVEHDMRGAVTEGVLESAHDLPAVVDREA